MFSLTLLCFAFNIFIWQLLLSWLFVNTHNNFAQVSTTERLSAAEEATSLSSEANLKFEDDLLTINMGALLADASDSVNFPADFLQAGTYHLKFLLVEKRKRPIFVEDRIFSFNVVNSEREIGVYMGKEPGSIKPSLIWKNND